MATKLDILKMLEAGEITPEEAEVMLDSLEDAASKEAAKPDGTRNSGGSDGFTEPEDPDVLEDLEDLADLEDAK